MSITQARIQTVAATYGANWSDWWALLQKLAPDLQQILTILLEQNKNVPMIAQSGGQFDITQQEVTAAAGKYGMDPTTLMTLLQQLAPVIARILLAILQNHNPTPAPAPIPSPVPNPSV